MRDLANGTDAHDPTNVPPSSDGDDARAYNERSWWNFHACDSPVDESSGKELIEGENEMTEEEEMKRDGESGGMERRTDRYERWEEKEKKNWGREKERGRERIKGAVGRKGRGEGSEEEMWVNDVGESGVCGRMMV